MTHREDIILSLDPIQRVKTRRKNVADGATGQFNCIIRIRNITDGLVDELGVGLVIMYMAANRLGVKV
jgi:hypothetical protein